MKWPSILKDRVVVTLILVAMLVVLPGAYVWEVNSLEVHPPLEFDAHWSDPYFLQGWVYTSSNQIGGHLDNTNPPGTLSIIGDVPLHEGDILAAQRYSLPPVNVSQFLYLVISIRTTSINVAARIVVWPDPTHALVLLIKTYPDTNWHKEVIDLTSFGLRSEIEFYMVELSGWVFRLPFSSPVLVSFKDLMIAAVPGGLA